jgi:predicted RNA-binding Zn-ribbon protein involved in translation (DUF1610 family)
MSMLTAKVENLRIMARLVRDYDYREISRELREAADTIENLRNRLTEYGMCDTDDYVCPQCGTVMDYVTRGDDDEKVIPMDDYVIPLHYCPRCGRRVVE